MIPSELTCSQAKPLHKYIETRAESYKFLSDLHNINLLITPIACGLKTLEGQNTTCSDVFNIWIGIAVSYKNVFADASKSCLYYFQRQVWTLKLASVIYQWCSETFAVYNHQFSNFLKDSMQDMFLLAYLLDPSKPCISVEYYETDNCIKVYHHGALRSNLSPSSEFCKAKCSPLFLQLIISARLMLGHEQARVQKGSESDGAILVQQLTGLFVQ